MKVRFSLGIFAAIVLNSIALVVFPHGLSAVKVGGSENWSVCQKAEPSKVTDIDLLLMMDNSTSLNNSKKNPPTDPQELRFSAVEGLFESIASAVEGSSTTVNFALIKFAQDAEVVGTPWTKTISQSTAKDVAKDVRLALPSKFQKDGTNFIDAMDLAIETFNQRKENIENYSQQFCPILVWFTDGQFSFLKPKDEKAKTELFDATKLSDLVKKSCDTEGFADQFRSLGVTPFVMLLKPNVTDANVSTSWDVMQHVTGMPQMPQGYEFSGVSKCGNISSRKQIGEVFPAENASELGPYFRVIACKGTGCRNIGQCPNKLEFYESIPLPATRFIQKIQITDLKKSINQVFKIQVGDLLVGSEEYFERQNVDSSTFNFIPIESTGLEAGWMLRSDADMEHTCVLIDLIDDDTLQVELKSGGGDDIDVDQVGNSPSVLTSEDLETVTFYLDGVKTDRISLFSRIGPESKVWGVLNVDNLGKLDPDGIRIRVIGVSSRINFDECSSVQFAIPKSGESTSGDMPPSPRIFLSQSCKVDLRNLKAGTALSIDISRLSDQLASSESCSDIAPKIQINGVEQPGPIATFAGSQEVSVALSFRIADEAERSDCEIEVDNGIVFQETINDAKGIKIDRQVRVLTSLTPPPCTACAIAITALVVGIAVLLSLLILRIASSAFTAMPDYKRHTALVIPVEIELSDGGTLRVTSSGNDISKIEPAATDFVLLTGGKDEIKIGSTRIARVLPSMFKPFSEPKARIEGTGHTIYKPSVKDGGLSLPFANAVIMRILPSTNIAGKAIKADLILLVRKNNAHAHFVALLTGDLVRESAREAIRKVSELDSTNSKKSEDAPLQSATVQSQEVPTEKKKAPPPPPSR